MDGWKLEGWYGYTSGRKCLQLEEWKGDDYLIPAAGYSP